MLFVALQLREVLCARYAKNLEIATQGRSPRNPMLEYMALNERGVNYLKGVFLKTFSARTKSFV